MSKVILFKVKHSQREHLHYGSICR